MERNRILENRQHGELDKSLSSIKSNELYRTEFQKDWMKQQMYYQNNSKLFDKYLSEEPYFPKSTQIGLGRNTMMWPGLERPKAENKK